jgi:gluconate 5-dehydrogenase
MNLNVFSLKNDVAIVTGGASGLGFAVCKCLHEAGAKVVMVSRRSEKELKKACSEIGENAYYRQFDVTSFDKASALVEDINKSIGDVTILVNNAGVHCKKPIEEMTEADYMQVLNVHIMGAFSLTRAVVPTMKKNSKGNIIFQASMTAFIGQPYVLAYSTAKSGYLGMTRTLATELSPDGIRVNAVAPGWIETPMLRKAIKGDDERKNKILGRTPMAKFGKPEDIGWAIVYLCSDAASFINGIALPVDGGALIGF